jgi:hypothetical protein
LRVYQAILILFVHDKASLTLVLQQGAVLIQVAVTSHTRKAVNIGEMLQKEIVPLHASLLQTDGVGVMTLDGVQHRVHALGGFGTNLDIITHYLHDKFFLSLQKYKILHLR